jgi:hypothetical protein
VDGWPIFEGNRKSKTMTESMRSLHIALIEFACNALTVGSPYFPQRCNDWIVRGVIRPRNLEREKNVFIVYIDHNKLKLPQRAFREQQAHCAWTPPPSGSSLFLDQSAPCGAVAQEVY